MRDPTAKFMRNNTQNHAYGYKPRPEASTKHLSLNRSMEVGYAHPQAEVDHNRSFAQDNLLAGAGKAQLHRASAALSPYAEKNLDYGDASRAAGSSKRQYANYNIITNTDSQLYSCLLYTSPSPRDLSTSRMPSSA
eukprot:TRINITY_DN25962_c0_g1_i3.p2 TRINITY_DN25962_c0_g1~~TRINITY_DN25962_c0_g1_i3.p2  ORF type:complete len:136 (-),score=17.30 TRINITY_DN25962_c0_g1_i3:141-548(-)